MNNRKLFLGVDPSFSNTGVVIIDNNFKIVKQSLICTVRREIDYDIEFRILYILKSFESILEYKDDLKLSAIEGISYGSRGEGSEQLAALNYNIRIFLLQNGIAYKTIAPTALKKFVTGKGQSKKNMMLKEVYKKWGEDFDDDNICDSYSLARMAHFDYYKKADIKKEE